MEQIRLSNVITSTDRFDASTPESKTSASKIALWEIF
jgi:hypothetical protein